MSFTRGEKVKKRTCMKLPLQDKPLWEADAYCGRRDAVDILSWRVQLLPVGPCHQGLQITELISKGHLLF